MADLGDAAAVRDLTANTIGKMTNPQLKRALTTLLGAERREEPPNSVLLDELRSLREEMAEMKKLKQEVDRLSDGLEKAYKIIHNQQLFLHILSNSYTFLSTGLSN